MYLIFDVGGTFVKHAIMDRTGTIMEKDKTPTPFRMEINPKTNEKTTPSTVPPEVGVETFLDLIHGVYKKYKETYTIEGIALSLPGQVNVEHGIVYGGGGLPYLDRAPLGNLICKRCDNVPVALENDGKCAALAEIWIGNARDCKDACVVVFGTGVGGGIVIDRKIHHGVGMIAGEMSFIYDGVKRSDLDAIRPLESAGEKDFKIPNVLWTQQSSVMALRLRVAEAKNLNYSDLDGEKIYEMAENGDEVVQDILEEMYFNIAMHCCNLYITLAPEIILIGGGISAQPKFFEGIVRYVTRLRRLSSIYERMKIDLCKFGNDSNLIGALFNFLQKYNLEK
ncbi:MAG: ROK family protein [Wujia sp.]